MPRAIRYRSVELMDRICDLDRKSTECRRRIETEIAELAAIDRERFELEWKLFALFGRAMTGWTIEEAK